MTVSRTDAVDSVAVDHAATRRVENIVTARAAENGYFVAGGIEPIVTGAAIDGQSQCLAAAVLGTTINDNIATIAAFDLAKARMDGVIAAAEVKTIILSGEGDVLRSFDDQIIIRKQAFFQLKQHNHRRGAERPNQVLRQPKTAACRMSGTIVIKNAVIAAGRRGARCIDDCVVTCAKIDNKVAEPARIIAEIGRYDGQPVIAAAKLNLLDIEKTIILDIASGPGEGQTAHHPVIRSICRPHQPEKGLERLGDTTALESQVVYILAVPACDEIIAQPARQHVNAAAARD